MQNEATKITSVIPVYNTDQYLPECFDSVLGQENVSIEIIIVSDGSVDESDCICDEYSVVFPNVIVIKQPNHGVASARNEGLKLASGQYIHFIDSDDVLSKKTTYKEITNQLKSNSDICFFRVAEYDAELKNKTGEQLQYQKEEVLGEDILRYTLSENNPMVFTCPVNKLFSRLFLIENELFFSLGIDHEEDEWLPRVISRAKQVVFDNRVIYHVRCMRKNSLTTSYQNRDHVKTYISDLKIAKTGIEYLNLLDLEKDTSAMMLAHYWEYIVDGMLGLLFISDKKKRKELLLYAKKNKSMFRSFSGLQSRNMKVFGWTLRNIGIRVGAFMLSIRYGRSK